MYCGSGGLFSADELGGFPGGSPQWLSLGDGGVRGTSSTRPPDMLPLPLAGLLNLSFEEGKGHEGHSRAWWELGRPLCTGICSVVSMDCCVAWNPLDPNLGVWSGVEDRLDVVNDLETEVLSCRGVWLEASVDGCLVVHKDPDGFDVSVLLNPLSGMVGGLQDAK